MSYIPDVSGIIGSMLANSPMLKDIVALQQLAQSQPKAASTPVNPITTPSPLPAQPAASNAGKGGTPVAQPPAGVSPEQQALLTKMQTDPFVTQAWQEANSNAYSYDPKSGQWMWQGSGDPDPTKKWVTGGKDTSTTLSLGPNSLPGLPLVSDDGKGSYDAKTNMGDVAAQVHAAPGAQVRLIDPSNGQVVAQGVGPQGAQQIASLASALSQKLGKQANWDIATETGQGTGQYTTMQGDRTDNPRFTLLSALKMVAPAVVGALTGGLAGPLLAGATGLGGGLSAGIAGGLGSGLTGLATGQSPLQALLTGVGSGFGAGLGGAGSAGSSVVATPGGLSAGIGNALGGINPATVGFDAGSLGGGSLSSLAGAGLGQIGGGLGALAGGGFNASTAGLLGGNTAGGMPSSVSSLNPSSWGDIGPNVVSPVEVTGGGGGASNLASLTGAAGGTAGGLAGGLAGSFTNPSTGSTYTPNGTVSSEVTVNGTPGGSSGPTITPGVSFGDPSLTPSPSGGLDVGKLDTGQNNNAGKDVKAVTDLLKGLLGKGGGSSGSPGGSPGITPMTQEGPGGGTNNTPGGTGNPSPTGNGNPGGGFPGLNLPSVSINTPTMSNVGAGTGGSSGVGVSGPGDLKLQGSLAPNVYPWAVPQGGSGGGDSQQQTTGL